MNFDDLLDLKAPVLLWVTINFMILAFRKIPEVPNWSIPFLAFGIGAVVFPCIGDPGKVGFESHNPRVALLLTGITIGGAALGTHQLFTSFMGKFGWKWPEDAVVVQTKTTEMTAILPAPLPEPPKSPEPPNPTA